MATRAMDGGPQAFRGASLAGGPKAATQRRAVRASINQTSNRMRGEGGERAEETVLELLTGPSYEFTTECACVCACV